MTKKKQKLLALWLIALALSAGYAFWKNGPLPFFANADDGSTRVVKVVDGDTIMVRVAGKTETVRMLGINTPETVDPRRPVQCFGKEASARLHHLLDEKEITLENAAHREDRDPYGRLLRYVRLPNGTDVNLSMLRDGYAYAYNVGAAHPRTSEYRAAEKSARDAKRGLWSPKTCNGRK